MNRDTYLIGLLSVNDHRLDAVCHHSLRYVVGTGTRHFYPIAAGDTFLLCKLDWYLDEGLRNQRPTPSGFMINGPVWAFGFESGLKSGMSLPTQRPAVSLHQTCLRVGSQGLPDGSHDARLYITRRFAGHDHAQF